MTVAKIGLEAAKKMGVALQQTKLGEKVLFRKISIHIPPSCSAKAFLLFSNFPK